MTKSLSKIQSYGAIQHARERHYVEHSAMTLVQAFMSLSLYWFSTLSCSYVAHQTYMSRYIHTAN
jgi:hypothetical protein